ncbi:MAG: YbbR-like domain-containing protein [Desulfobacteraceae bacterium]|nr:YbbR-like domain-containing protein [Desulfobacteraceae bacterium]
MLFLFSMGLTIGCHSEPVQTDLLLPVEFSSIPINLILTSPSVDKLEISVSGNREEIEKIKEMDLKYSVDLYTDLASDPAGEKVHIDPRTYYIPVLTKRIFIPGRLKILSVSPSYIRVGLEKKVVKSFAVSAPYTGTEAPGYAALSAKIEPAKVTLTGPESAINSIKSLKTKPIDLSKVKESFKKKMPVDLHGLNTISEPAIVTVFIPIEKKKITKTFENIHVELKNAKKQDSVNPSEIGLTIKGWHDMLNRKEIIEKIKVSIDVKGLKSGVYVRNAVIDLPLELIMINAEPEIFTVKIE